MATSYFTSDTIPPLRKRRDLVVAQQRIEGEVAYILKDPIGLRYSRLQPEEFAVWQMLDGEKSLAQLQAEFAHRFASQQITLEELQAFLNSLMQRELVVVNQAGQGRLLAIARQTQRRRERLGAMTNLLAIRFSGVDPDRFLTAAYPRIRWIFSPIVGLVCLLLVTCASLLLLVEFETFQAKLPAFHEFFTPQQLVLLALALGGLKIFHELGHAFACKHFGGECHEIGVLFLVFTPCLYCDVSDSWLLSSKWQRAAIGAAGMVVELVIAAIATFIWWNTQPGVLNYAALSVMFVGSVSTVVFNGNPLMRYDGYYILSDLLEVPNLRQKASQLCRAKLAHWFLGIPPAANNYLPRCNQGLFAFYAVAVVLYGWFVVAAVLWFLFHFLEPLGLGIVGYGLGIFVMLQILVWPLWRMGRFIFLSGVSRRWKASRLLLTCGIFLAIAAVFLFLPLPHHAIAPFEVQQCDMRQVFVDVPGSIAEVFVAPGDEVPAGQPLARLENLPLRLEHARLVEERDRLQLEVDLLRRERFGDPLAQDQLRHLQESLASLEKEVRVAENELARLTLRAPVAGSVLWPPQKPVGKANELQLVTWSGTPLDVPNRGAFLRRGEPFCAVGDASHFEAVLVVDQSAISLVRPGQHVAIKLDELPHVTLRSEVGEVALAKVESSPLALSMKSGGELRTRTANDGRETPFFASFLVRMPLNEQPELLLPGLRGRAKIKVGSSTLAMRAWRWLNQTFHLQL